MRVMGDHYGDEPPFSQIILSKSQVCQLLDAAESSQPYEAVGMMVGGRYAATDTWRVVELDNEAPITEATSRCEVGTEQMTALAYDTMSKGLDFNAWWHSHPTTAAKPSALDRECPMPLQIIVTAADVRPSQRIRAWWVRDGAAYEIRVERR